MLVGKTNSVEKNTLSWYRRPNQEDRINRKPVDLKNDQRTKKVKKNIEPNRTVLNLFFNIILHLLIL